MINLVIFSISYTASCGKLITHLFVPHRIKLFFFFKQNTPFAKLSFGAWNIKLSSHNQKRTRVK